MRNEDIEDIRAWLVERGLAGATETELLDGFCERCARAGHGLCTAATVIDTLHPIWEGRAFFWRHDGSEERATVEYESSRDGEGAENWRRSAFHHLVKTGQGELRRRFCQGEAADFYGLDDLQKEGHTDCLAFVQRFPREGAIGEMDAVYSHWSTRHPEGFAEDDCAALRQLVPSFALAMKCSSLSRIIGTLAEVYLGRDAGQRVLSGRISRGVADQIRAVLWFSDLKGYTAISDGVEPNEIIPLLDDYADAVISAIHGAGGDVMKLIGDGVLAIFQTDDPAKACHDALQAAADMRRRVAELNRARASEGRPTTIVRLGLHIGDVFYGNIGSDERLDFTVVGPAVNEVSRIVAMGLSVDRDFLVSEAFVAALPEAERGRFVSVGRFALRGVRRAQELLTPEPEN